jgi:hypothetical protein
MITEDDSKQSSMPTEVKMTNYPDKQGYMSQGTPDLLDAVNKQQAGDSPKKIKPRKA